MEIKGAASQTSPGFRVHAIIGYKDIAFPNLNPQMKAMYLFRDTLNTVCGSACEGNKQFWLIPV